MLIDRAVSAYRDFIRITGWTGNLSIHIEGEFFGADGPKLEGGALRPRHAGSPRRVRRTARCPERRCRAIKTLSASCCDWISPRNEMGLSRLRA